MSDVKVAGLFRPLAIAFLTITVMSFSPGNDAAVAADLSTAIVDVAKNAIPAIVHIEVTERQEVSNPMLPFENDPLFRRFFGIPNMPRKFKQEVKGLGGGMIMDAQGHILTNYHVAGGATKIEVVLSSGQRYPAKLVGGDAKTDLAVVKIEAKEHLSSVKFGDSDKMEVGQWVVAIGAPRGLDQTVTQGIISAKHRRGITDPSGYEDFLQTDAAINPGNSGGPLLNLQGEVIGVNSVIASSSGGFEGIGFSIPSNIALHIGQTLIAHGKVTRGWLGISIEDVTWERAKALGMAAPKGASVMEVMKGGPAEAAGILKGDTITAYDGIPVTDASTLRNQVATSTVGKLVKVEVLRDRKTLHLTVKIGDLADAAKTFAASVESRLGAQFRAVTPKEAEKYGLTEQQGVAVVHVDPKGPLGQAGFEVNDIILEINGQAVAGIEGFLELTSTIRPHARITLLALDHATGNTGQVRVTVK